MATYLLVCSPYAWLWWKKHWRVVMVVFNKISSNCLWIFEYFEAICTCLWNHLVTDLFWFKVCWFILNVVLCVLRNALFRFVFVTITHCFIMSFFLLWFRICERFVFNNLDLEATFRLRLILPHLSIDKLL